MLPAILGVSGLSLTPDERDFIRDADPFGFILFRRNIESPEQTTRLIDELSEATDGRRVMPVLVDQEGGRVQRLRPPHWVDLPHVRAIGDLYMRDPEKGILAARLQAQCIAGMLLECGFTTVCAPVLDVPVPGAHDVIGNRAFSEKAETVATLATIMTEEFLHCGLTPILKHAPGHGRATSDSHYACPVVSESCAILDQTDFLPYRQVLKTVDPSTVWAMTAHVVYTDIDAQPVSVSSKAITHLRNGLGLSGLIIPDAIEMEALGGTLVERALATLNAGCDVTMYCAGNLDEAKKIAVALPTMTQEAMGCAEEAEDWRQCNSNAEWRECYKQLRELIPQQEAYLYEQHQALNVA